MRWKLSCLLAVSLLAMHHPARAGVMQYGDKDVLGTGSYPIDPTTGATLQGLAPGAVTFGAPPVGHVFPFTPSAGEFPGTDQIFVGSVQTGAHDGYSVSAQRINGPQTLVLDYSSLVPPGSTIQTLTLGIAADDFQFPSLGQPFTATINGVPDAALTSQLNALNQGGPVVQFFTIGISPASLLPSNILTLAIDQGGDGGDGWAADFLTVGVTTTAAVPEPATLMLLGIGAAGLIGGTWRRRKQAAS
jgi:hypothetical protein